MSNLYPMKFTPICKPKIWGGHKIKNYLNKDIGNLQNCGESWEISCVEDDVSVVSNGFLIGNELEELIEVYMGDLVGEKVYEKFGTEFPLLIKFIDANDKLSIQVHPNDELALERHGGFGKTEMWYVIQADKGSQLISGFNRPVSKEEYLNYLNNGRLEEILKYHDVKAGDVFFMPAGRVHAIGEGILLSEIQQTSDLTYRIYDFNRKDEKGNLRELHTEYALDAIDFSDVDCGAIAYSPVDNSSTNLVKCKYFTTNLLHLTQKTEKDFAEKDTFVIYMCLEGEYWIRWEEGSMLVVKGETILVPAMINSFSLEPVNETKVSLLEVYID